MEKKKPKRTGNYGHKAAGRKPYEDETQKKVPVQVYVKEADIELIGGKEVARTIALTALQKEIKKKTKK